MKKIYINYSDEKFTNQQNFALFCAKWIGAFDETIGYTKNDIDDGFVNKFNHILSLPRGGGYWLWKPYFITKTLSRLSYGDVLFYSDAAAFFLKKADNLITELNKYDQDIIGFELPLIEEQWTKQELFNNMDCNEKRHFESNQIMGSFMLIKKTLFSAKFFQEFLNISCDEMNITDKYNQEISQSDCFIDHRHDQSIFSLLYKKYNLRPFKDPSQFGENPIAYSGEQNPKIVLSKTNILPNGRKFRINIFNENYSMVIFHYRKGNPVVKIAKYYIREILQNWKLLKSFIWL
jgi:hypothetical protein